MTRPAWFSGLPLCLALGTLALLPAWDSVTSLPAHARSAAALGWVVGGTAVLTALLLAMAGAWRAGRNWRWLVVVGVALPMAWLLLESAAFLLVHLKESLVVAAGGRYLFWRNVLGLAGGAALSGALAWTWWRGWGALRAVLSRGLSALGALPLVFVASTFLGSPARTASPENAAPAARTTVVVVFDELDASVLARHIDRLPNFRRLQATAMSADAIYPPANYTTESLPGMISGQDFEEASYTLDEIHVRPAGQVAWQRMSTAPSIFSDAIAAGQRVDVVGWHLPYCAVFRGLSSCWDDAAFRAPGADVSLVEWMLGHSRWVGWFNDRALERKRSDVREFSKAFFASPVNYRLHHIGEIFQAQRERLLSVLRKRQSEMVFAHLACPHPPSQVRAEVGTLDVFEAYDANLLACDRLLGEVTELLGAQSGAKSTLLVTSDHWFRGLDWQDTKKPMTLPRSRRAVPFYLRIGDADGKSHTTAVVSNTRVLRTLGRAMGTPGFDYEQARSVIEREGDGTTRLRRF
jgi:hypothetical protein